MKPFIILLVTTVISLLAWAGIDRLQIGERVTTIETQVEGINPRLDRIENKVDRILERSNAN